MQVDLPIDRVLARYGARLDADLMSRVFTEAFRRVVEGAQQGGSLTAEERALLDAAGFAEPDDAALVARVARDSAAEQADLFATAPTVEETAARLRLNPSRVRQLIGARQLIALRDGRLWRLPLFQFEAVGDGLRRIPNAGPVLAALPDGLAPIAAARWFTSPNAELNAPAADADGQPLSPRDWLLRGYRPEPLARLAAELAGAPQGEPGDDGDSALVQTLSDGIATLGEVGDRQALQALRRALDRALATRG